ncbi:MAG: hypothetical protein HZA46_05955 [Planctomycetales bacterium]|nr:hypothetical protein [Planctomycetales bacterium]
MSTVLETAPVVSVSPTRRRHWWRTLLWGLVIFVCGGVTGHGVTVWMWQEHGKKIFDPNEDFVAKILLKMRSDYELTDDQATQIEAIMRGHNMKVDEIRKDVEPRFSAERKLMNQEISAVLNDPQREKWQKRMEELKRLWSDKSRSSRSGGERRKSGEQRKTEATPEKQESAK